MPALLHQVDGIDYLVPDRANGRGRVRRGRALGWNGFQGITLRSAASTDGRVGLAVLDSGKRLGLARYHHCARGVGCADTGSGCPARRDLELLHSLE